MADQVPVRGSSARTVFHIIDTAAWRHAQDAGEVRPPSLSDEGFVHCSFADQVAGTLARHFDGVQGLLVLEFDPAALSSVRVEDSHGSGQAFPHVYGPLPVTAVIGVRTAAAFAESPP